MGKSGRRRLALAAALGTLLVALVAPASSSAVTFGANLSRAADNTVTCNDYRWTLPYPNPYSSCSFSFQNPSTGESSFPPAGQGVVSKIRVKVGPVTGPMQVVVEQALRKDNPASPGTPTYACCQAINASQVFVPQANGVTEVPVNLPVRSDLSPDPTSGYYVDQHLALSVLAANVPIPANNDPSASYVGWFPAWKVGDERAGPYNGFGGMILLNADWGPPSANAASCPKAGKKAQASKKKKKKACGKKKKKK